MADFCMQCSLSIFKEDSKDLMGLSTEQDTEWELYVPVLCEGCGMTYVDHAGKCVSDACLLKHGK